MWRAKCRDCDFVASRFTRDEAEAAMIAHVEATGHLHWSVVSIVANPEEQQWPRKRKTPA